MESGATFGICTNPRIPAFGLHPGYGTAGGAGTTR